MASSTEILALCDMLKQSKLHVCISIRVVASFGRKITGGVGASLVVRDAPSLIGTFHRGSICHLEWYVPSSLLRELLTVQGAGPRYPYPKEVWSPSGTFLDLL